MEDGLLSGEKISSSDRRERWSVMLEEMKWMAYFAGPMVAVGLSLFLLQNISLMIVGHLGKLYLSSTALAISFATVSGFSFLVCIFPLSVSF